MQWQSRFSNSSNYQAAFEEVTQNLGNPDLIILFIPPQFAPHYQTLSQSFRQHFPDARLFGCSASGLIAEGSESEFRAGLALAAATLPKVEVQTFALQQSALPDLDAPPQAWHDCLGLSPEDLKALILLIDPFSFEPNPLLVGLDYAYPKVVKLGGLVSGTQAAGQSLLLEDDKIRRSGAIGLAFSGELTVEPVVAQGCRPIGEAMVITECEDYMLKSLDGVNALEALTKLLRSLTKEEQTLASHSLFIGVGMGEPRLKYQAGDFLVRNIVGFNQKDGSMAVGADLRPGKTVQFHLRDARTSAQDLRQQLSLLTGKPEGALMFSCLGRGEALYKKPNYDSSLVQEKFPNLPMAGFFCNGEIGPVGTSTYMHGYTSSIALFKAFNSSSTEP